MYRIGELHSCSPSMSGWLSTHVMSPQGIECIMNWQTQCCYRASIEQQDSFSTGATGTIDQQ
jgi:hypothetical protein